MVESLTSAGDRLLGMLVPRVVAKADPCGTRVWRMCGCRGNYERHMKLCCSAAINQCGQCVRRGSC